MSTRPQAQDMAAMPVQLPEGATSPAGSRARFFNSGNAFNIKLPPVPARSFTEEAASALTPGTASRLLACDQSAELGCPFPATTPLMLARYASIPAGRTLTIDLAASASIWYAIAGGGLAAHGADRVAWAEGDVLLLPGGGPATITAGPEGAVLWGVTNEPQLAFDGLSPAGAPVELVHYPAAEIACQIDRIYERAPGETTSGIALIFSSDRLEAARNITPTMTLSLNTLPAGTHQRAHRHNSAAITLILRGDACYSMVDGLRCDWAPWATMVTPPGAPHSHHNEGPERALFLIVQDGGLHYHARTMGFEFLEQGPPACAS